ncbi:MAG: hypothetical protein A3D64_00890 [Candidatus Wildermuthbacteria bacterium RIFCSPHIGHO2_02_FULL_49_9]|uniref:Uncharacterized protein n=1 Tax=Candidatus Wildermuthbacteria bacterium RIFCSPHIGHO2_02_FULL_49_9 TaxID=1802456 RepID=A0A1G2RBJ0_9BACT|nr:MAG: hypothetical protein A3D64_00890 [Candidatus Wildermuthbacteria bacterium RIFCSPHIGHO2_02_FULL_49_9]
MKLNNSSIKKKGAVPVGRAPVLIWECREHIGLPLLSGVVVPLGPATVRETTTDTAIPPGVAVLVVLVLVTTKRLPCGHDVFSLPGKLEAGIGSLPVLMGSGDPFRKCRWISAPVTGPSTPARLNSAVAPAGQSHGKSSLPVSNTPVSLHFVHFGMVFLLSRFVILSRHRAQISRKYSILRTESQGHVLVHNI